MATLREYFDTELNKALSVHRDWELRDGSGACITSIRARISKDFDANAKYWSFFIPTVADLPGCICALFACPQTKQCVLSPDGDGMEVEMGFADYPERASSTTLVFTGRVFLYVDMPLEPDGRRQLAELGKQQGLHVAVRDRNYAAARSAYEKPLAFISHDSRDKEAIVRELAIEMSKLMCPVWYDDFSLKVGDSLRASIERGLKETKKCIFVLSPNFFSNEGWGRVEFDSVFTREILEKDNIMLPIWHNVGVREVYDYSPRLADRVGLNSSLGVKELARQLSNAVKHDRK